MPLDPAAPSTLFVRALLGEAPEPDLVANLDPAWQDLIQAAQEATPERRRATILLAKSGQSNLDRLLAVLRPPDPPAEQPWPEPTPFGRPSLPEFPHHVLPSWLGNIVRSEARATQTHTDLAGLLSLAVLATACAGRVTLNPWGDWLEPLNLFLLVALPPGHRKSAVFASIVQPLQQYEADAAVEAAPQLAQARRARHAAEQALLRAETAAALASDDDRDALLALAQRRADDLEATPLPVLPRLIVDDCSPERLAMLLHQQGGRLAILSPEGGIFDLIAGRYSTTGAPNLDHILKGHAGDPIIVDRVGRPGEIIPRPALTIGLAVQPEVLRGLVARPGFHGRGLLARFLYAVPTATLGHRSVDAEPVPDSLRVMYRRHILALLQHLPTLTPQPPLPLGEGRGQGSASLSDSSLSSRAERACERSRGISAPETAGHPTRPNRPPILPFTDDAADRLSDFARSVEPRLAPGGDLDPIVDWGSKLVGATARIAGLLHLADLAPFLPLASHHQRSPAATSRLPLSLARERGAGGRGDSGAPWWDGEGLPAVSPTAVDAAVILADYLVAHARAAYAAMGLDPAVAHAPVLLDWLRRARPATFTRRDAQRAIGSRFHLAADLDDALATLEQHGYIRARPAESRAGFGRPRGPVYEVHPSLAPR